MIKGFKRHQELEFPSKAAVLRKIKESPLTDPTK